MTKEKQIEIPLSKTKLIFSFLGSLAFVALGIWFIINPNKISNPFLSNPSIAFIVGLVFVLFFGFIGLIVFRKITDQKPGLVINSEGIIDNSSGVSAGLIPWTDILEIKITNVMNQKFIMLVVANPETYIEKETKLIKRNAMKMNFKSYGSPISITANSLKTDFNKLHQLLVEKMNEYKS